MKRVLLSWSSGKDSAWALHELRRDPNVRVEALLTTFNAAADRVAMHAVRRELVERQARAAGLPLWDAPLPSPCSNEQYEAAMRIVVARARDAGLTHVAFGDLFLEDVRRYREERLAGTGLEPLFPLWRRPTLELAGEMLAAGLRATLTCVDPKQLDGAFVGRAWDAALLAELPGSVDPCGERGEFHTFCHAGPMFDAPIDVDAGARVDRDGFCFVDVKPLRATVSRCSQAPGHAKAQSR
jgi:uncharacterized protein (TIGR00290 family)